MFRVIHTEWSYSCERMGPVAVPWWEQDAAWFSPCSIFASSVQMLSRILISHREDIVSRTFSPSWLALDTVGIRKNAVLKSCCKIDHVLGKRRDLILNVHSA